MLLLVLPLMMLACPCPACAKCPGAFHLSDLTCLACAQCPALLTLTPSCGPGPEPGVCLGGLRVTVSIDGAGASPVNLTLALSNYSGVAGAVQVAYSVTVGRLLCPLEHFRSVVSQLCVSCTICQPPANETSPCTGEADRVCGTVLAVGFEVQGASFLSEFQPPGGLAAQPVVSEDIKLSIVQIPCADAQFRSPDDQLCSAWRARCAPRATSSSAGARWTATACAPTR